MTLRDDPPIALIDNGWAQNIAFCELDERKCPNKQKYILNTLKKNNHCTEGMHERRRSQINIMFSKG